MKNSPKTLINEIDAKGAKRVRGMPYVLGISLVAVILLLIISYAIFVA